MRLPPSVRQYILRIRPMKAIVKIGFKEFVMDAQEALQVAGILMHAELFESKYHGDKGSTYHVYEQDGTGINIEMMSHNRYQLCKLAGKPVKEK